MDTLALILLHVAGCVLLLWTVFCRACQTDCSVRLDVRLAFFVLGIVAGLGLLVPLVSGWRPDVFGVLLLLAICLIQMVTARHWRGGVPHCFYRPERAPRRRAGDVDGVAHG